MTPFRHFFEVIYLLLFLSDTVDCIAVTTEDNLFSILWKVAYL